MKPKYFYQLNHDKYIEILELLADPFNTKIINKILEKTPKSDVNPLTETQIANAFVYEGHILIDMP